MTVHFFRAALQSATRDAAKAALVGEDLGTVETGKLADLLMVNGNPLVDLRAAADIRLVIKNGRVFTIDEILAPARPPPNSSPRAGSPSRPRKSCAATSRSIARRPARMRIEGAVLATHGR